MAGAKALQYAEDTLKVHSVYEEAQALAAEADTLRGEVTNLRKLKHTAEIIYLDAEYDFISDLRGANKDMSQTAFDKFAKQEIHRDPNLRAMRADLAEQSHKIEQAEANLATVRSRIEIASARMHELGGYLAYLAAVKEAENKKIAPSAASTQGTSPWPGVD